MEWIEVVDTTIKIGLGALISGIATYYTTSLNHKKETDKHRRAKKHALLDDAVEHIDTYFSELQRLFLVVNGVVRISPDTTSVNQLSKANKDYLYQLDQKLSEVRPNKQYAETKLYLLNLPNAIKILASLEPTEIECRKKIFFNNQLPSLKETNENIRHLKKIRKDFFEEIRPAFDLGT